MERDELLDQVLVEMCFLDMDCLRRNPPVFASVNVSRKIRRVLAMALKLADEESKS